MGSSSNPSSYITVYCGCGHGLNSSGCERQLGVPGTHSRIPTIFWLYKKTASIPTLHHQPQYSLCLRHKTSFYTSIVSMLVYYYPILSHTIPLYPTGILTILCLSYTSLYYVSIPMSLFLSLRSLVTVVCTTTVSKRSQLPRRFAGLGLRSWVQDPC